ncbi:glutathione S-transferase [Orussus abietinus]|uniref:glutathione S-transferase n=1 Tax=Orussus abietinus TaxID=222816 RepID=UPI000625EC6B|nr:glutathione S-transferase [Orussus abietinus]
MTNYKLIYFDLTGLGEPIRFMLSYGGVKFEDKRINSEEWKELKPQIPMGQLPVLEIDGKKYYQSKAIGRFLAKKFDLYGSDEFEAMEIDAVVDTIDDLRQALVSYTFEEDPDVKAKLKEKNSPKVPLFLEKLESLVERNGGYFVGGKLSWPDIVFAAHSKFASHMLEGDVSKDHPELKKLTDKVLAIPNIKKYVDGRPDTRV